MRSLWSDDEAKQYTGELGLRVYASRLLGRDRSLVLHGGGNTSVKIRETNLFGEQEDILYIKGSGWDLETIEPQGFSPVRLAHVLRLAALPTLSDAEMVNQLATHMLRASAPAPSIETILHGCLPYQYVDHTHADSVLAITDTAGRRGADPRGLRRPVRDHPLPHAGVRPGAVLRARIPETEQRSHHRHGAAQSRHLLLRRQRAGILRTDDRPGVPRRGLPSHAQRLEDLASSRQASLD